jgi:hypothetical protein
MSSPTRRPAAPYAWLQISNAASSVPILSLRANLPQRAVDPSSSSSSSSPSSSSVPLSTQGLVAGLFAAAAAEGMQLHMVTAGPRAPGAGGASSEEGGGGGAKSSVVPSDAGDPTPADPTDELQHAVVYDEFASPADKSHRVLYSLLTNGLRSRAGESGPWGAGGGGGSVADAPGAASARAAIRAVHSLFCFWLGTRDWFALVAQPNLRSVRQRLASGGAPLSRALEAVLLHTLTPPSPPPTSRGAAGAAARASKRPAADGFVGVGQVSLPPGVAASTRRSGAGAPSAPHVSLHCRLPPTAASALSSARSRAAASAASAASAATTSTADPIRILLSQVAAACGATHGLILAGCVPIATTAGWAEGVEAASAALLTHCAAAGTMPAGEAGADDAGKEAQQGSFVASFDCRMRLRVGAASASASSSASTSSSTDPFTDVPVSAVVVSVGALVVPSAAGEAGGAAAGQAQPPAIPSFSIAVGTHPSPIRVVLFRPAAASSEPALTASEAVNAVRSSFARCAASSSSSSSSPSSSSSAAGGRAPSSSTAAAHRRPLHLLIEALARAEECARPLHRAAQLAMYWPRGDGSAGAGAPMAAGDAPEGADGADASTSPRAGGISGGGARAGAGGVAGFRPALLSLSAGPTKPLLLPTPRRAGLEAAAAVVGTPLAGLRLTAPLVPVALTQQAAEEIAEAVLRVHREAGVTGVLDDDDGGDNKGPKIGAAATASGLLASLLPNRLPVIGSPDAVSFSVAAPSALPPLLSLSSAGARSLSAQIAEEAAALVQALPAHIRATAPEVAFADPPAASSSSSAAAGGVTDAAPLPSTPSPLSALPPPGDLASSLLSAPRVQEGLALLHAVTRRVLLRTPTALLAVDVVVAAFLVEEEDGRGAGTAGTPTMRTVVIDAAAVLADETEVDDVEEEDMEGEGEEPAGAGRRDSSRAPTSRRTSRASVGSRTRRTSLYAVAGAAASQSTARSGYFAQASGASAGHSRGR